MPALADPALVACPHCGALNRVQVARLGAGPTCGKCKVPLFTGAPLAADAAMFDRQVGKGSLPVLVDFWAEWCGPCKAMAPAFAQAARELEPTMRLLKLDTEAERSIAARYGIQSIPTLILFRNGREVARQSGAMPSQAVVQWARSKMSG